MKKHFSIGIAGLNVSFYIDPNKYPRINKVFPVYYKQFPAKGPVRVVKYSGRDDQYALANYLRKLYSGLLPARKGFLLHASGVISRGKGYIFTGVSGAGKTTVAEASKRYGKVLSDEIVAVRKTGKKWKLYGTPFMGLMKGGGRNKVASNPRLLFLKQAKNNALKSISTEKAWEKFLRNVILFKPEKKIAALSYDFVKTADKNIMEFRKKGFWRVLWAAK